MTLQLLWDSVFLDYKLTLIVFNCLRIQWDNMCIFLSQSVEYSRYLIYGRYCFYRRNLAFLEGALHMGILVARSGVESVSPAVEVWSFNQWTAREVPRNLAFEEGMAKAWDLIMDWGLTKSSDFQGYDKEFLFLDLRQAKACSHPRAFGIFALSAWDDAFSKTCIILRVGSLALFSCWLK